MRAFSAGLATAKSIHALVSIQRGEVTLRFTTWMEDVTFGGNTYTAAPGAAVTSIAFMSDGTPNNADILIMAETGGVLDPGDGVRGILDGWPITVRIFDPADPEGTAYNIVPGSTIGSVAADSNGLDTIAAEGQMSKAGAYVTEHYSLAGREDLFDDRCKVVAADFTNDTTGQATGTHVVTLDALPDIRATDPTWYVLGGLFILSGNLAGYPKIPIRAWNPATLEVTLFLPVLETDIPAGTALQIHAGCDLTREMCFSRFNNIINLRAETFVPPPGVNF
jgi:uncharacterized phage protein (TIGR02218 family)